MLLEQLFLQETFSDIEKTISAYILENGEDVCQMSIQFLADKTYSSPSTIMRLCRKLGSQGFSDFKIRLKEDLVKHNNNISIENLDFPFFPEDTYKDAANKLAKLTQQSIYNTHSLFDYNIINLIVNKIKKIDIIDIYGQGSSQAVAYEFKSKMIRLGKSVHLEASLSDQLNQAINSNNKHLAIVISHSGENEETLKIVHALKHTNTCILGITREEKNQLTKYCDFSIYTGVNESKSLLSKIETFSSHISTQYVLDCLYTFVYLSDFDNNFNKTKHNENILRNDSL